MTDLLLVPVFRNGARGIAHNATIVCTRTSKCRRTPTVTIAGRQGACKTAACEAQIALQVAWGLPRKEEAQGRPQWSALRVS